jgi:hypothetical protein
VTHSFLAFLDLPALHSAACNVSSGVRFFALHSAVCHATGDVFAAEPAPCGGSCCVLCTRLRAKFSYTGGFWIVWDSVFHFLKMFLFHEKKEII